MSAAIRPTLFDARRLNLCEWCGTPLRDWSARFCSLAHHELSDRLVEAAPDLLQAAEAAWQCIAELSPTQARVEVVHLLQAAIEKAKGSET